MFLAWISPLSTGGVFELIASRARIPVLYGHYCGTLLHTSDSCCKRVQWTPLHGRRTATRSLGFDCCRLAILMAKPVSKFPRETELLPSSRSTAAYALRFDHCRLAMLMAKPVSRFPRETELSADSRSTATCFDVARAYLAWIAWKV